VGTDAEKNQPKLPVRINIYHAAQDDPKKNTALRLSRRGYARIVTKIRFLPKRAIVLNPFGEIAFSPADRERLENFGLAALDCSWEQAQKVLGEHVRGTSRCLPILIAGNPVNF
jgi:pre-rRNA-processing protein TSR3